MWVFPCLMFGSRYLIFSLAQQFCDPIIHPKIWYVSYQYHPGQLPTLFPDGNLKKTLVKRLQIPSHSTYLYERHFLVLPDSQLNLYLLPFQAILGQLCRYPSLSLLLVTICIVLFVKHCDSHTCVSVPYAISSTPGILTLVLIPLRPTSGFYTFLN